MYFLILLMISTPMLFGNSSTYIGVQEKNILTLQVEEVEVLEDLFKTLCIEDAGGYVLCGKKPVCINGYDAHEDFSGSSECHRNSVRLREGMKVWKRFPKKNEDKLVIHVYDQPDSTVSNYIHVLFINKELFIKTVHDNLTLFQYVLGSNLTPESLLKEILDPKQTFYNVLKEDKVLIGILLGFGTQNALAGSRIENIQEAYINGNENVPLKNPMKGLDSLMGHYKYVFLNHFNQKGKVSSLKPSSPYKSFEDEITNSIGMIEVSSTKLSQIKPHFVFGKLKNSLDNDRLTLELETAQEDIIDLYSSGDFFKNSMKMIYPNLEIAIERNLPRPMDKKSLLTAVSQNTYNSVSDETGIYFQGFIKGLQDAGKNIQHNINDSTHFEKLKVLEVAKKNVDEADRLISELEGDGYISVEKGKIIYRTSKSGSGSTLNEQGIVRVNCRIKMPNGEVLKDTWAEKEPAVISLNDAISGFAWGMKGMQEGEIREIIIHPSAAYGLYTNLDKGIHLSAEVELISIETKDCSTPFTPIEYLDFAPPFNFLAQNNFEEISKNEGYLLGYKVGSHYKKQDYFSIEELIEAVQKLALSDEKPEHHDSDLVNRLHWEIYHLNEVL